MPQANGGGRSSRWCRGHWRYLLVLVGIVSSSSPSRADFPSTEEWLKTVEEVRSDLGSLRSRLCIVWEHTKDQQLMELAIQRGLTSDSLSESAKDYYRWLQARTNVECCRKERRSYSVDPGAKRLRVRIEDLRDLDAAAAAGHLPGDDLSRSNTSMSGIGLQDWSHFDGRLFWSHLRSRGGWMSVEVLRSGQRSAYTPPLEAGVVPLSYVKVFEQGPTTTLEIEDGDRRDLKVSCTTQQGRLIEATLDPTIGFRYRAIEERLGDGRVVRRYTADDFRDVGGGIIYPFLQVRQEKWDTETGTPMEVWRTEVESAEFGVALTPEDFSMTVPQGTSFTCLLNRRHRSYEFRRDATLTLDALMELAKRIDETTEATGLMNIDAFHRLIGRLEASAPPSTPGHNPP